MPRNGLIIAVFLTAVLHAHAAETAKSVISPSAPERFHTAFTVSGKGRATLAIGAKTVTLASRGFSASTSPADAALRIPLPEGGAAVECYCESGRADLFVDKSYCGSVDAGSAHGYQVSVDAEGDVSVQGVKFSRLHDVYFRDDFMRGAHEPGTWRYSGARLEVVSDIRPDKSASPFRLECKTFEPGEIRTGNPLWRGYSAAAAFLLGETGTAALGTHLRGDTGLWAELSSSGRFTVRRGDRKSGALLLETAVPMLQGEWHEIALSPTEAAIDGVVHSIKAPPPLGGETAIVVSGPGTSVDDARIWRSPDLARFLNDFRAEPGAIRESFQRDAEMADWARGRFLWHVEADKKAVSRCPVFGERAVVLGSWNGESTSLIVRLAAGCVITVKAEVSGITVTARLGEKSGEVKAARGEVILVAREDGLHVGNEAVVRAEKPLHLEGAVEVELVNGRWPNVIRLRSPTARDFTFDKAPTGFVPVSGDWRVSSRWRCSPEFTWYSGAGDPAHIVYRYPLEGDGSIALAFAPGMTARAAPFYNWPMGCVVALSPDPVDPFAGVAYVAQGLTGPALLYVQGRKIAQDTGYQHVAPSMERIQELYQQIHHRWDIIRITRSGRKISAETAGMGRLVAEDEVVSKPAYLHILTPSKSLAIISRLFLCFEGTGAPEPGVFKQLVAPQIAAGMHVNGGRIALSSPPRKGPWAFAFNKAAFPDAVREEPNGAVTFTMYRPGLRWAAGAALDKPIRISEIAFDVSGGREMHASIFLDTDIGPVRIPLFSPAPPGPFHDLPPPAPAKGNIKYALADAWRALGAAPLVKGVYIGELDRISDDIYGASSHVPGRSITIGPLTVAPLEKPLPIEPDETMRFLTAPVEVVCEGAVVSRVEPPGLELARLGHPQAAPLLGYGSQLGYTTGAALVRILGGADRMLAVNPRMSGPAGIWIHRADLATNRVPLLALKTAPVQGSPPFAWDLIKGTRGGKQAVKWMDNKTQLPQASKATYLRGPLNGWTLFEVTGGAPGAKEVAHGVALADANWYSSSENSSIAIDGAAWGVALAPSEKIRVAELAEPVAYTLYSLVGELLEEGQMADGCVRPLTVDPTQGQYVVVLRYKGTERMVPVQLVPSVSEGRMQVKETTVQPAAALISEGAVSTFFTDDDPLEPLVRNRRGTFPTLNPPPDWVQPRDRELDDLSGGLLIEPLDKTVEGFYLLDQDSGWAGRQKVLRAVVALPKDARCTLKMGGQNYMDAGEVGLAPGTGEYRQVECFLPGNVDSAYLAAGERACLIRAVSVSEPGERRMRLRFFGVPADGVCGWRVKAPDGAESDPNWLSPGEVEARFRIDGPAGIYEVVPSLKTTSGETRLRGIQVEVK